MILQCPECHVALVADNSPQINLDNPSAIYSWSAQGSPDQKGQGGGRQNYGGFKLVFASFILMACGAYAFIHFAEIKIRERSEDTIRQLTLENSNLLVKAAGTMSRQISNQITAQLAQPRIQSVIDKAARDQVDRVINSKIAPSLQTFEDAMTAANALLAESSNAIEEIRSNAVVAQSRIPLLPLPGKAENGLQEIKPHAVSSASANTSQANTNVVSVVHMTLVNRGITQSGTNYILSLVFRNIGTGGFVDMAAATYKQTARIMDISSINSSSQETPQINDTGDVAKLRYMAGTDALSSVVITLSGPTIVRVLSDSIDPAGLTIPVAAERLNLGATP